MALKLITRIFKVCDLLLLFYSVHPCARLQMAVLECSPLLLIRSISRAPPPFFLSTTHV